MYHRLKMLVHCGIKLSHRWWILIITSFESCDCLISCVWYTVSKFACVKYVYSIIQAMLIYQLWMVNEWCANIWWMLEKKKFVLCMPYDYRRMRVVNVVWMYIASRNKCIYESCINMVGRSTYTCIYTSKYDITILNKDGLVLKLQMPHTTLILME